MRRARTIFKRWLGCVVLAALALALPGDGYAQGQSCSQLANGLNNFQSNRDFRTLAQNSQTAQQLQRDLQRLEQAFVRAGCQQALDAGQRLTGDCSRAARQIISGRRNLTNLQERVQSGQAIAQQVGLIRQQMDRQQCDVRSSANVNVRTNQPGFFDQLFDALSGNGYGNQESVYDPYAGTQGSTVRSVCVRLSDGYYWPISFSTLPQFLENDALQCRKQCPGADVSLYYYHNPGETPEDMVSLNGTPYKALPNAFSYRQQIDPNSTCKPEVSYGSVDMMQSSGESRAFLNIDDISVPLPLRDPRGESEPVVIAAADVDRVHVPLPRPRPDFDDNGKVLQRAADLDPSNIREVEVGGRTVRIVGPETPFAQPVAGDS